MRKRSLSNDRARRPHVADLEAYARDVAGRRILAGRYTRLACERHLRDVKRSRSRDFPYRFDRRRAERACRLAELFPHVKGKWAKGGETIVLGPWQKFIVGSLFGWVAKRTGARRFREGYLEVARKNAKSTLAAVIGLICFALDGEAAAEVYAGATTEKQAWETFGPARLMLEKSDDITEELGIEVRAKSIIGPDGSKFEPIIGNPGDGASPSCAIIDEYHEHPTSALFDTMVTGMGAREQPLALITTTSGYDISGPCFDKHEEVKRLLDGLIENEQLFGIIYSIDLVPEKQGGKGDDWTDPKVLAKANPNIGVSVFEDYLLAQQRNAVINTREQNRFKTKHLNVWSNARSAWMNLTSWKLAEDSALELDEFVGQEAYMGVDLASKVDLAAVALLFKRRVGELDHLYAFAKFYCPEAAIESGDNADAFRKWVKEGHITMTPGAEIDFDVIRDDILELSRAFQIREIGYDPWRATQLAHQLEKEGATVVEIRQNTGNLSAPMKELEGAVKGGRFHHPGNPVLTWSVANVVCREDNKQNVFPVRPKANLKIDGALALIMAASRAIAGGEGDQEVVGRLVTV